MENELAKEKIAWYKLLFTILATAQVGSISWFVSHYDKAIKLFAIIDIMAFFAITLGLVLTIFKIRYYFKKLEIKNV